MYIQYNLPNQTGTEREFLLRIDTMFSYIHVLCKTHQKRSKGHENHREITQGHELHRCRITKVSDYTGVGLHRCRITEVILYLYFEDCNILKKKIVFCE